MRIFRSTYTIPIAILLTLLIVMGCAPEEPELVATAAPTNIPSETPTTTPVIPAPSESAATPQVPTPEPAQDSTATITPLVKADPTATPQLQTFNVGDTVRLGDLHVTVNGVRASLGDNFWAPEKGAYFIYVDVTFRNEGDQPEVVSTLLQMEMGDAEGRSYDIDISAIAASGSSSLDGEIAPGGSLRGEVGYQLPTSVTDLTWHFFGDIFRLGQAIFSLGNVPVPVLPLGFTLDDPLPAGEVLLGSDGTEIRVLGIIPDARRQVAEENSFNDPPEEGMRFYMIRLEVVYPADAFGFVDVAARDFSLIGNNRVVYVGLSCGVIPDRLRSEIFAGGRVEGNICLEIPENEGDFILIHEPGYGADSRRFLRLPYGEAKEPTPTPEAPAAPTTTPTPTAIPTPESTPTPASTATPTPKPTPVAIGTTVEAGGSSYTLNEVKDPAPAGISGVNEGKRLIALDITQVGISGGGDSYNPFYFAIQDTDGYVYTPGFSDADVGPPFGSGKLSADQIVRGWVVFELTESARLVSVLVAPGLLGAKVSIADFPQGQAGDLISQTPPPVPTPPSSPVAIRTTVEAGGSSYTLNEVKDPAPAGISGVNEGKRLIALDITQVGISGGGDSYNPFYFAIQDTDGYVYTPGFSDADVGPPFGSGKLSADQIVRGWVVFELTESARLVSVLVAPGLLGARITIADLAQE